jgi:hypothetical protein
MQAHSISVLFPVTSSTFRTARVRVERLWRYLKIYADTCAGAYAVAALYEELSKRSNAELERRGIARGHLNRHIADVFPRRATND